MHNQVPGSEWVIDPLPESAFRSSVRRVAVVTDVYLPKVLRPVKVAHAPVTASAAAPNAPPARDGV